ncbi:MAG: hypothetical protein QW548_02355 [Candidatus Aenigmatarchaeota archaeon]
MPMEHRTHIAIISIFIVAAVIIIIAASSFQLMPEPSGYFRIAPRVEPRADVCFDTDGGANRFVRGATSYLNWSFVDDCSIFETAEGTFAVLYEGYCEAPDRPAIAQFNCTRGCENGACVR